MKRTIFTIAIIAIITIDSFAQTKPNSIGSWVIESNVKQPKLQIIKFYGDSNHLLYTETIKGRLNINRKKVRQNLDKVLDSLTSRSNYGQNSGVLAVMLKH